jgi:hypothetical protein
MTDDTRTNGKIQTDIKEVLESLGKSGKVRKLLKIRSFRLPQTSPDFPGLLADELIAR